MSDTSTPSRPSSPDVALHFRSTGRAVGAERIGASSRGASPELVLERGCELARRLGVANLDGVKWLGPAAPQVARLQGFHRRHLLVKAVAPSGIRRALGALRASPGPIRGVEEPYDVDPVGLL